VNAVDAEEIKAIDLDYYMTHRHYFDEGLESIDEETKTAGLQLSLVPTRRLLLAARFLRDIHYYAWIGDEKGHFVRYIRGKWHDNVHQALSAAIQLYIDHLALPPTTYRKGIIMDNIQQASHHYMHELNRNKEILNFRNGFLDTTDFSMDSENTEKKYLFTYQIPHAYKPGAGSRVFLPWLFEMLEGNWDSIDLVLKFMGYAMTLDVGFQRNLIIKGPPRSGKSTLLNVIAAMVGEDNRAMVPLQRLSRRFGTTGIVHKILNYYVDISTTRAIYDTSRIKILIDEEIDVEFKGGALTRVKNVTKHIFSTNRLPPVKALDLAYCRRWAIVEFPRELSREEVIPGFEARIIEDEREMEGIIALCVDAYKELVDDGYFKAQSAEEVMELIMAETDSVYRFVRDCCDVGLHFYDDQDTVYTAYVEFAEADGALDIKKKGEFTKDLKSKGYGKRRAGSKNSAGKRPYLYTGLKLQESEYYAMSPASTPSFDNFYPEKRETKEELGFSLEDACRDEILEEIEDINEGDEDNEDFDTVGDPFNL